jgi:uncharacterized small protein (DUF1192 family)
MSESIKDPFVEIKRLRGNNEALLLSNKLHYEQIQLLQAEVKRLKAELKKKNEVDQKHNR